MNKPVGDTSEGGHVPRVHVTTTSMLQAESARTRDFNIRSMALINMTGAEHVFAATMIVAGHLALTAAITIPIRSITHPATTASRPALLVENN